MKADPVPGAGLFPFKSAGWLFLASISWSLASASHAQGTGPEGQAFVLEVRGAIGPATADYVGRGLGEIAERGGVLAVLSMDTPGGLDTSMREIIRDVLASPLPVLTYVNPSGARAASAGTYILYASHVAAMAPGTNLGAATPIALGGGGLPLGGQGDESDSSGSEDEGGNTSPAEPRNASEAKAVNDAVAYIRSLAELRGRNADWAERAVREAASLASSAALEENVIDVQAANLSDVLAEIDGRTVMVNGNAVTLATAGVRVETLEPGWRTRFLAIVTNPNVAMILMMIGIYGLIFEFMSPGALYPGIIGAISLLIGLYALAVLPVNFAGAGLLVLGVALMAAEAFVPSFGALGLGGAVATAIGATILIDTDLPQFALARPIIAAMVVTSLAFSLLIAPMAVAAHRRKVVSGSESLIDAKGTVMDWAGSEGHVLVQGERWNANSSSPLSKGDTVRVVGRDGLTIVVEPDPESTGQETRS